ncbi:MAG: hypothetical protein AAFY65_14475 [Pseudomonadota bacterium]
MAIKHQAIGASWAPPSCGGQADRHAGVDRLPELARAGRPDPHQMLWKVPGGV